MLCTYNLATAGTQLQWKIGLSSDESADKPSLVKDMLSTSTKMKQSHNHHRLNRQQGKLVLAQSTTTPKKLKRRKPESKSTGKHSVVTLFLQLLLWPESYTQFVLYIPEMSIIIACLMQYIMSSGRCALWVTN